MITQRETRSLKAEDKCTIVMYSTMYHFKTVAGANWVWHNEQTIDWLNNINLLQSYSTSRGSHCIV